MNQQTSTVDPEALVSYLKARQWRPVATWRGTTVWGREPESDQVLIPDEPHSASGRRLLRRAVLELAEIEARSPEILLAELAQPQTDVQRFRLLPSSPSGTIPISHGRRAIDAIYSILRDAGRNAFEGPKLYHRDKPESSVNQFLDRVHLTLTEPGSYVFTTKIATSAQPDDFPKENHFDPDGQHPQRPSDHQVVLDLQTAVVNAHRVAAVLADSGRINNPSEQGISANLCKALADLSGEDRKHQFEISFSWGEGDEERPNGVPLHFTEGMASALHGFGSRLERLARTGPAVVEGTVAALRIEENSLRRRIQVKGTARRLDGSEEEMSLWVFVSDEDYGRAFNTQQTGRTVRIEGHIVAEHGGYRMHLGSSRFTVPD